ncbi:MAG TPA: hypothetical protein VFZ53_13055 [Polyangiaceae bacterium]
MKFSLISTVLGISLLSGAAFAQARDTTSEPEENDTERGPGGTRLAFDLDYSNAIDPEVGSGLGGAVRFGREYDLVLLSLTPELMGNIHTFSGPGDSMAYGAMAGGRATIGKVIEPGVFAHIGGGHASLPANDSVTGLAMDLGVTLDLTLIPIVDLGIHGAWDSVSWEGQGAFDWYRVGAHIALAP